MVRGTATPISLRRPAERLACPSRGLPAHERRRGAVLRRVENLTLVQRLLLQERLREGVERAPVLCDEPLRLVVALADDPEHLGVDRVRSLLAVGTRSTVAVEGTQERILPRRQVDHAQPV